MSDMKCPFCGGEMIGSIGHRVCHYNPKCPIYDEFVPQEVLDKLDRTRKAFDVAVDALKLFDSGQYTPEADAYGLKTDASRVARKALKQIESITKGE